MDENQPDLTTSVSPVGVTASVPARRRSAPYVIGAFVGALAIGCLIAIGFLLLVQRGVSEVMQMGPWPAPNVPAKELVTVDLSNLGLDAGPVQNARAAGVWTGASYADGAFATYSSRSNVAVSIWALKYADGSVAARDFDVLQAQIAEPGTCGISTYASLGYSGVLHCQYSDAYQKVFWNDSWIVGVEALEGTTKSPDILVDLVRDALAAHWQAISKAAS